MNLIQEALEDLKAGKMVILVDDEDRENEGDLVCIAEFASPETINFMATHGRGLICLAMAPELIENLELPMMVRQNKSKFGTAFTVSIEARTGVTTGISVFDRSHTIQTAIRDGAKPNDLITPGHVFPLKANAGGVLVRAGQTEGSVDLAKIAGKKPAAVICEIMSEDGTMARMNELDSFSRAHDIKIISIADLITYRLQHQRLVRRVANANLPSRFAVQGKEDFKIIVYENDVDQKTHVALVKGDVSSGEPVLVRMHSGCITGDVFGSNRCDCSDQLQASIRQISDEGRGAILYMQQEGRGIGLVKKIQAYFLQDQGLDTVEANERLGFKSDLRTYGLGAQMLLDLGIKKLRLLTNNPKKIIGLQGYGLEVVERVAIQEGVKKENLDYLKTKKHKMGHMLELPNRLS